MEIYTETIPIVSIREKENKIPAFTQQAQCNSDKFIIKIRRRIFRWCVFINIWSRASFAGFPIWKTKNISRSLYKLCTRRGNMERPTLLSRFKNGILIRRKFRANRKHVQTQIKTFRLNVS